MEDARALAGMPENFQVAVYTRPDDSHWDNLLFPLFVRRLKPDLVHIPLNRVPDVYKRQGFTCTCSPT